MIKANAHSDCGGIKVFFDATKWAEQASDEAFIALGECGFRGDYPADDVVMYMANNGDPEAVKLFKFIELVPKQPWSGETNGFECEVDQEDLKLWLEKFKPELVQKVFG